ncbi:Egg protein [Schistosoma japonicum]|uniref:Egg protein n=1 Tax=Schistosoma japonicum TaxID=6182 RepID=A0A4Z2D6X9_SCHJA|nr:Egg protein [Schistosoma japonicum]
MTEVLVEWNPNYQDHSNPEYHQLRNKVCKQLLQILRNVVPLSQDDGKCEDVTYTPNNEEANADSILLLM